MEGEEGRGNKGRGGKWQEGWERADTDKRNSEALTASGKELERLATASDFVLLPSNPISQYFLLGNKTAQC